MRKHIGSVLAACFMTVMAARADQLTRVLSENDAAGKITLSVYKNIDPDTEQNPNGYCWVIRESFTDNSGGRIQVQAGPEEPSQVEQPSGWSHNMAFDNGTWVVTWVYEGFNGNTPNEFVRLNGLESSNSPLVLAFTVPVEDGATAAISIEGQVFGARPISPGVPGLFNASESFVSSASFVDGQGNSLPTANGFGPVTVDVNSGDTVIDLWSGFDDTEDGASGLSYVLESVTDIGVFENVTVDNSTGTLTIEHRLNLLGNSALTIKATDSASSSVTATIPVIVSGSLFQQWLNTQFSRAELSDSSKEATHWGELADLDGDGLSNLAETYHGASPSMATPLPLGTGGVETATNKLIARWERSVSNATSVTAVLTWSPDLTTWYADGDGPSGEERSFETVSLGVTGDRELMESRLFIGAATQIFAQLNYRQVP